MTFDAPLRLHGAEISYFSGALVETRGVEAESALVFAVFAGALADQSCN